MKKIYTLIPMLALSLMANAQSKEITVTVSNNSNVNKKNEPVAIKLKDVKGLDFNVCAASVKEQGMDVAVQLDDMDGDMLTDELFFVTDIKAHGSKTFNVTLSKQALADVPTPSRIYTALQIRDKKDLHPNISRIEAPGTSNIFNDVYMHGITIESELVGFRIYFDERQNIDLYGKKKQQLELEKTQFYTSAEQLAEGYGTDVLWAGKAMGCGSFKRYSGGEPANWLGSLITTRGERIVTNGPLRTVIEVYDLGMYNEEDKSVPRDPMNSYDVHQYYSLYAGHRDLQVDVVFNRKANAVISPLATGVQKVGVTATDSVRMGHTPAGILRKDGIAASWGCDYPDMGKKQLWGPEPIGMAVYVPSTYIKESKEDDLNYVYVVEPKNDALHYWTSFCCAKEEKDSYQNAKDWFASLDEWKESISHPVIIKIK